MTVISTSERRCEGESEGWIFEQIRGQNFVNYR